MTNDFYCTDCGSEVVHCTVVELHTLVDEPPATSLLILPVLDDLIHGNVSLDTDKKLSHIIGVWFQYLP